MRKKQLLILLFALLVISVATLLQTIIDEDDRLYYGIATIVSHIALVVVGTTYARGALRKGGHSND